MRKFIFILTLLALVVIALGAYTRLSDAGLGCPDWPGCYGHLAMPTDRATIDTLATQYQQTVEPTKAWTEMIHRYVAGSLAVGILVLLIIGIVRYFSTRRIPWLPIILSCVIVFQALLGMWTVTLKLLPPIILLHLFGGLTTLSLLWCYYLSLRQHKLASVTRLPGMIILGIALLLIQIALGGWTSANYAALICPDFPYCQGQLLPDMSFDAFMHSGGIAHDNATLVTIHMAHRIGAIIVASYLLVLGILIRRSIWGIILLLLVSTQVLLGVLNIVLLLPMTTAVAHNITAMLIVLTLLGAYSCSRPALASQSD